MVLRRPGCFCSIVQYVDFVTACILIFRRTAKQPLPGDSSEVIVVVYFYHNCTKLHDYTNITKQLYLQHIFMLIYHYLKI